MTMRDLRKYASQTHTRLIVGGLVLLFLIGDGLIYLLWGAAPALMGVIGLGAGLLPILLILIIFWIMDWIVRRANQD